LKQTLARSMVHGRPRIGTSLPIVAIGGEGMAYPVRQR
jgi:hypothetical protein